MKAATSGLLRLLATIEEEEPALNGAFKRSFVPAMMNYKRCALVSSHWCFKRLYLTRKISLHKLPELIVSRCGYHVQYGV